ncbi:hypothetical protein [Acinetobacter variabilis]|uniref:Uncharacterized protein n=1 Tax=Acinetobacter variabilis TaxID=70346 RepID=N8VJD1_9GAMM|nr:hypothetical protein [Acinetobacter variabilis]ENU99655.1 hypothetical protein F969_01414 [Acinetobacter variabilis]
MDIQKEREEFELSFKETDFYKMNLVNCFCFIADRYVWDEVQAAWEMWQTAIARMKVQINTLDEMLLNQGEALAQAKTQAVPEGFVVVPKEPTDEMWSSGIDAYTDAMEDNKALPAASINDIYKAMIEAAQEQTND